MAYPETDAEKAAERTRISGEISALQNKIRVADDMIASFRSKREKCAGFIDRWNIALTDAMQREMAAKVQVKDKFEGDTAKKYARSLSASREMMKKNIVKAQAVVAGIDAQIEKLRAYIDHLRSQISGLSTELSGL